MTGGIEPRQFEHLFDFHMPDVRPAGAPKKGSHSVWTHMSSAEKGCDQLVEVPGQE